MAEVQTNGMSGENGLDAAANNVHDNIAALKLANGDMGAVVPAPEEMVAEAGNGHEAPMGQVANGVVDGMLNGVNGMALDANGAPPMQPGQAQPGQEQPGQQTAVPRARGQNTQVFTVDGDSFVRLHQTNIISIRANGDVSLSSGGWRTHQTMKGINTALKTFAPGLQVVADGHVTEGAWRVSNGRDWSAQFYDNVTIPGAAPLNLAAQASALPGLFEQMVLSAGFEEGEGGEGGGGKGGGRGGKGGGRGGNRGGGEGEGFAGGKGGQRGKGGAREGGKGSREGGGNSGKWQDRPPVPNRAPLPAAPPPQEELPSNFEAYDEIPVEASGEECPPPVDQFAELGLHPQLQHNIELAKFVRPTPVQRHAIPVGMAKRDLMACAQTGSGKTGAFLFPIINQLLKESEQPQSYTRAAEPRALILAPTRELATQIFREAQKFCQRSNVTPVVVYGGADIRSQINNLERGCQILVATPGRLSDLIERGKVALGRISHFVMDEADRMLDMGFEPQIRRVVEREGMPPTGDRQTMMFSATFPKEIQKLASEFMARYIFVAVGRVGSTTALITQTVLLTEEQDKRRVLVEVLSQNPGQRTIIFVETKRAAEQLEEFLYRSQIPATSIHGDRSQREREQALQAFRRGSPAVLVATDVAARGLDVPDCMHVVNFELPRDINSYVHRIGRTGRMGRQGAATSLYTPMNKPVARELVALLQEAQQVVPEWLQQQADSSGRGGDRGYQGRGKFGGRDYRANTQMRQYKHSGTGSQGGNQYGQQQQGGGYGQQQQGGYGQQQGGYMQHKQAGMYAQGGMPGAVPQGGAEAQWAGWQQQQQQQQQMSSAAYQQQMAQANGQRGAGAGGQPGWMGMPGAQASYAQYYGQQAAQPGAEQNGAAMMQMGMMWPQQQQMPGAQQVPEGQYAAALPQEGQYAAAAYGQQQPMQPAQQ